MKDYKVLILGWKVNCWEESKLSVNALSYNLYLAFKEKLGSERVTYYDKDNKNLPVADFIVIIVYASDNILEKENIEILRKKTNCKKIITLREIPFNIADLCFVFNPLFNNNNILLPPPCNKSLLQPTNKESKTILIDHYWKDYLNTDKDWTFRIEEWIEELSDTYKIYRLIRFPDEEKSIKTFEQPLYYDSYLSYLNKTAKIENFIVTHQEGFPYGVIDFAARGTRVLVPDNKFIPQTLIDNFNIPLFKNKKDFISLLNQNIDESWNKKINSCIDFKDIVNIMDVNFQGIL